MHCPALAFHLSIGGAASSARQQRLFLSGPCHNCPRGPLRRTAAALSTPALTPDQDKIFNTIVGVLDHRQESRIFLIDGPARSGKTFLLNAILRHFRHRGHPAIAMSSSMASVPELYSGFEMAAALRLLCSDEHTAHSTRAIVWDDCTAATRFNIDSLDSWLQYVLSSPQPFGNIPVIFAADWTGTGHPIPSDVAPNFFGVSPLNAAIAGRLTYLHLPGDIPYVALPETAAQGVLHRPVAVSSQVSSLDDLIGYVYDDIDSPLSPLHLFDGRAVLSACAETRARVNSTVLEQWPGNPFQVLTNSSPHNSGTSAPAASSRTFTTLKLGAFVTLTSNVNAILGLHRGVRMCIIAATSHILYARVASPSHAHYGTCVCIPGAPIDGTGLPSFPVELAYAMPLSAPTSLSYTRAGLDLRNSIPPIDELLFLTSCLARTGRIRVLLSSTTSHSLS